MRSLVLFAAIGAVVANVKVLDDAVGDLSVRLIKHNHKDKENLVFSGFGIASALGLCFWGSRGETSRNIKQVLGFGNKKNSTIAKAYSERIWEVSRLAGKGRTFLGMANRVYIDESLQLSKDYTRDIKKIFGSSAIHANFRDDEALQEEINAFISENTRGMIPKMLERPLPAGTVMASINALFFKGLWRDKLSKRADKDNFNPDADGSNQKAEWIGRQDRYRYTASMDLQAEIVELPYASAGMIDNWRASMFFIVPDEYYESRISEWIAQDFFTWSTIAAAIRSMDYKQVDLVFPKFKQESSFPVEEALKDLGMKLPFTPEADFSGMLNGTFPNDLHIDQILHTAHIEVDEYGTKSSPAVLLGEYGEGPLGREPKTVVLKINRSFIAISTLIKEDSILPLFTTIITKLPELEDRRHQEL